MHIYRLPHIKTESILLTSYAQPEKVRAGNLFLVYPLCCRDLESPQRWINSWACRGDSTGLRCGEGSECRGWGGAASTRDPSRLVPLTVKLVSALLFPWQRENQSQHEARSVIDITPLPATSATAPQHLVPEHSTCWARLSTWGASISTTIC